MCVVEVVGVEPDTGGCAYGARVPHVVLLLENILVQFGVTLSLKEP